MAKSIIKELIIILLLALAIILVLGILLYEYVPSKKILPEDISYSTSQEVKQLLEETKEVSEESIPITYSVTASDLSNYQKIKQYKAGKANPFSSYSTNSTEGSNNTNSTNNSTSSNGSNNSSTTENTNTSGGSYFQDKGTK